MRYLLLFLLASCSHHLTETQVKNDSPEYGTFDTLAAYRKMPGQIKDVNVKGYVRNGDSVKPYKRSKPSRN
jgi:hypothetical protein